MRGRRRERKDSPIAVRDRETTLLEYSPGRFAGLGDDLAACFLELVTHPLTLSGELDSDSLNLRRPIPPHPVALHPERGLSSQVLHTVARCRALIDAQPLALVGELGAHALTIGAGVSDPSPDQGERDQGECRDGEACAARCPGWLVAHDAHEDNAEPYRDYHC